MVVFRRRRAHVLTGAFNNAAGQYFTDDTQLSSYYFDDGITLRYVAVD